MLPVEAVYFYHAHVGRTVLPTCPFWAHPFYSVFYIVSELGRACFRQARVAQAMLPPGALFHAETFGLPPCAHKSHMCPLPPLGFSDTIMIFKGSVATRAAVYRGLRALRPKIAKKNLKTGLFGVPEKKLGDFSSDPQKLCKKTWVETFFAILGPEGPESPVDGGSGRKAGCKCPSPSVSPLARSGDVDRQAWDHIAKRRL